MNSTRDLTHQILETIDGHTIVETPRCGLCGEGGSIALTDEQFADLEAGAPIQGAAGNLSRAVREQFISGTHGTCWDDMFGPAPE